jgi:hypothetical protein
MATRLSNRSRCLAKVFGGVLALLAFGNTGCFPQTQVAAHRDGTAQPSQLPTPRPSPSTGPTDQVDGTARAVTFYQDVLPILRSNTTDRIYRCTVCHAPYNNPEMVAKPRVIDAIIDAIETQYMPPFQNRMRAEDLEVLKLWRRSGMQTGNQASPESGSTTSGATR